MLRDSFIIPRVKSAHLNIDKINQYFTWNKSPKRCKSFCFNRPILNSFLKIIFYLLGKKLWAFLNFSSFRTSLDFCHCLPTLRLCLQRSHCGFCFSTRKHAWPCLGHPEHPDRATTNPADCFSVSDGLMRTQWNHPSLPEPTPHADFGAFPAFLI